MAETHISDMLFMIVHDEFTGRVKVSPELLNCGLVAAQLAELVIGGRLGLVDGRIALAGGSSVDVAAEDPIGAFVVEAVERQQDLHTVRTWINTFDGVMGELVARRLIDTGLIRRERSRGILRRTDRFPAVDLLKAAGPRIRLEHMLRTPAEFDLVGAVLAALIMVLGIDVVLDPELDRTTMRELVSGIRDRLPGDLAALLDGTADAVAAISLTVRR